MDALGKVISLIKPLVPVSIKNSLRRFISFPTDDVHFRICSPATAPELAQRVFELHRDGLLEDGGYYEFGIFRGYSLWFVQDLTRRLAVKSFHCHGFDSFHGLPAPSGVGDEGSPWGAGDFAASREQVEGYLSEFKADLSRISLHEGFFSDELFASLKKKVHFQRAALVLVDCDLYSSTVPVLKFICEYLADGTIMLFDDYNCFDASDDRGQRRALSEFLAQNLDIRAERLGPFGWHGEAFCIRRARRDPAGGSPDKAILTT